MMADMTPEEEYEFYATPENREPRGKQARSHLADQSATSGHPPAGGTRPLGPPPVCFTCDCAAGRGVSPNRQRTIRPADLLERGDQAFFASGVCHILAWTCRRVYQDRSIRLAAMRFEGERRVFHVYATWETWSFDHAGWNAESDLLTANTDFEGRAVERIEISSTLTEVCAESYHRMPDQYWRDPLPRAIKYVDRHSPPWAPRRESAEVTT